MILWLAAVAISAAPNRRSSIATNTLGSLTLPSSSAIERATYLIGRQSCPGHPPAQHVYNFSSSAEQAATRQLMLTANTSVAQALFGRLMDRPLVYQCGAKCTWCALAKADGTVISTARDSYLGDLRKCCALAQLGEGDPAFLVQFGDLSISHPAEAGRPVFAKTRPVATRCGTLLPLEHVCHWARGAKGIVSSPLVPWERKVPTIVWRGGPTGLGQRRDFVHALSPHFDVRFHGLGPDRVISVARPTCDSGHAPLAPYETNTLSLALLALYGVPPSPWWLRVCVRVFCMACAGSRYFTAQAWTTHG